MYAFQDVQLVEEPVILPILHIFMLMVVERRRQRVIRTMRLARNQHQIESRYPRMREQEGLPRKFHVIQTGAAPAGS